MSQVSHRGQESDIYREAQADAGQCSIEAKMAYIEVFAIDTADPALGEVERFMASERHRAFTDDLNRCIRIIQLDPEQASRVVEEYESWAELARQVRERVTVRDVLELSGFHVTGSGAGEAHSPCPVCGGRDRLVIWTRRCWCRKCQWSADAIALAQTYLPGCQHFRDAVRTLSTLAVLSPVPS